MAINWIAVLCAAPIPLVIGAIWYNIFGKAWQQAASVTDEQVKGANMPLIMGLSLLFNLFLSAMMAYIVVHQAHYFSVLVNEPGFGKEGSEVMKMAAAYMSKYGSHFRTFKHGALHGFLTSILFVLPVIGTHALYERRGAKYIGIHWGYWAINLMLMGGLISAWT